MVFWIVAFGVALVTVTLIALALLRGGDAADAAAASETDPDLGVYRDQLRELDRDLARGVIAEDEAERARLEVSRRLLEADKAPARPAGEAPRGVTIAVAVIAGAATIGGALALYARLGAPGYPDMTIKSRLAMAEELRQARPAQAELEAPLIAAAPPPGTDPAYLDLVEKLRAAVAERPGDVRGLEFLASSEARLGNFAAARIAQEQLIAAKGAGATSGDHAGLVDLMVLAAGGVVSPEAEAAIDATLLRDPKDPIARYYLGLLHAQTARPDLAFRQWDDLLQEGPPDAPWIAPIRGQIEQLAFLAGVNDFALPPEPGARGPSQADIAAAGDMTPEERQAMIRTMVAGLAERLASEGGPVEDWARLIRAYGVLGEPEKVAPVVAEARQVFAGDPEALAQVEAAARDAGVTE